MEVVNLRGRPAHLAVFKYRIDWERTVSRPQRRVKDFLRPYWEGQLVLEEAVIPNSRKRIDLWNVARSVIIEVSPRSTHEVFNPFFHGSLAGYRARIKSDLDKARFAEMNKQQYVVLVDEDLSQLSAQWFLTKHGIML